MKRERTEPERASFKDEKKLPWLGLLLDALYIVDKGIQKGIELEIRRGRSLACRKGCSNCCRTHRDIPVYPLEIMGISWYVRKEINDKDREILYSQLRHTGIHKPCPFLIDNRC